MSSEPASGPFVRLHPATLPLRVAAYAKTLLLPAVVILLVARDSNWELWATAFLIPATVYEVFRYMTLRYRLDANEIVVRAGLVFRNERHIPYSRIQNIDLVQGPLARVCRVAEARLETASGSKPEAVFKVLSLSAIEQMRRRVFAERATGDATVADGAGAVEGEAPAPRAGAPDSLLKLSVAELVKLGLISNRGLAVVAVLLGVMWEFDLFERLEWAWAKSWLQSADTGALVSLAGLAMALAGLGTLMAFSVAWTIVRFYDFTLERRDNDLRLSFGLLTRHLATVPRRRIQFVSIHESVPHRWFDRVSVRVETAGGSGKEGEGEKTALSRRWFAPLVPKERANALLAQLNTGLQLDGADWRPLAPKARARKTKKTVLLALLATGGCLAAVYPWGGLAVVALVPAALWYARASIRAMSYARLPDGIAFRSGVWTRKVSATLADRVQVVSLVQSPFDRRYQMASIRVDTAGAGPAGHRINVPYVEESIARGLQEELVEAAQRSVFRW